ncbi:MAG TPA: hypothetical protein EYQ64_14425 [Gemmatimonadetes bacterium]|nr:hypothetical protein [Gemmatimonadota bacterium]
METRVLELPTRELLPFGMMIRLLSVYVVPLSQTDAGTATRAIQVAAEVSTVAITVLSVLVLVVAFPLLLQFRRLLRSIQQNVQPVADRARVAAENLEYISAVVREDVQKVRASVAGLSDRLGEASERMEERVEEFNALMDVVQEETESVLLDTAAVVRGVRAGALSMGEGVAEAAATRRPARPAREEEEEEEEETKPSDPTPLSAIALDAKGEGAVDGTPVGEAPAGEAAVDEAPVDEALAGDAPETE